MKKRTHPGNEKERVRRSPVHIVWSTDRLDLSDPFVKRWYVQQVLHHGRMEDLRSLDLHDVKDLLPQLNLPPEVRRLWEAFFARRDGVTVCRKRSEDNYEGDLR